MMKHWEAPAEWGLPKQAPLDQVAALFQPTGEPIDDTSPPSMMPDRRFARAGVWHNIWLMGDEPGDGRTSSIVVNVALSASCGSSRTA